MFSSKQLFSDHPKQEPPYSPQGGVPAGGGHLHGDIGRPDHPHSGLSAGCMAKVSQMHAGCCAILNLLDFSQAVLEDHPEQKRLEKV